jgi:septum formation protein
MNKIIPQFVLASASPARRLVLANAGFHPLIRVSNFDESQIQLEQPEALVRQLAKCKAEAIATELNSESRLQPFLVMGCDSVMWVNSEICGKPRSREEAIAIWQKLRGGKGIIYSGHCLIDTQQQKTLTYCAKSTVYFVNASDHEISSYIATGEPMNCAGCFTLEGLGGLLVEKIEGCHTNVLGLSLPLLRKMLKELGYSLDFSGQIASDRRTNLVW